jgi:dCMP deaminase
MTWERYALELAHVAAKKSKDPWRQVGAVVLRHDCTVAGVGYNGFPAGVDEHWECRERRRLFVVHAEENALRYVKPEEGCLIATTTLPCNNCLKAIVSYGIRKVVYSSTYPTDESTLDLAKLMGVELMHEQF